MINLFQAETTFNNTPPFSVVLIFEYPVNKSIPQCRALFVEDHFPVDSPRQEQVTLPEQTYV